TFHEGNSREALAYLSQAMALGNSDYKYAALKQVVRSLSQYSVADQVAAVTSDKVFVQQSALWYLASRSSYRNFDYAQTIVSAEQGLRNLGVPLDRLPFTTNPRRISEALARLNPDWGVDRSLLELVYILHASRELVQLSSYLQRLAAET